MLNATGPQAVHHGGMRILRWRGAGLPGSPLVLLHGLGDGADIWSPVLRAWPGGAVAAIAPDLPGHGGSDHLAPKDYTLDVLAEHVACALEREAISRPVLIGHSLGARIVLQLAASGRVKAARLVIVDVDPSPQEDVGDAVESHLEALKAGAPNTDTFVERIAQRLPLADREVLKQTLEALSTARECESEIGVNLPFDPEISRLLDTASEADGWAQLSALDCPTAIVRGAFSSALSRETAERMATTPRFGGPHLTVPSAGHAIALEQPAALAQALAEALARPARPLR